MHSQLRAEEQITLYRDASQPPEREIAALAYGLWTERGCPIGPPDDNWFQAEAELRNKVQAQAATA
jgi:hypothetical protein